MKQARPSSEEVQALADWFLAREAAGESCPQWRRTIGGYEVLFSHAGDPAKDYIDWKPSLIAQKEVLELIARFGGQLVEDPTGGPTVSCNGSWCAEQARRALEAKP